jgi:hypothetical protein
MKLPASRKGSERLLEAAMGELHFRIRVKKVFFCEGSGMGPAFDRGSSSWRANAVYVIIVQFVWCKVSVGNNIR